jgi:excinuclease ABC subunit A
MPSEKLSPEKSPFEKPASEKLSGPKTKKKSVVKQEFISVRGARVHNLKSIDIDLPHNQISIVTGVSGSGKSSLVFDTIYAEGQRRYVESLSAYARQFLERMEKPDVDEIVGIAPPIAIKQKNQTRNPRSTVATSTEIYDYLRLLYARVGHTICPKDGVRVKRDTIDEATAKVLSWPVGSKFYVLFAAFKGEVGLAADTLRDELFNLRKLGFNRLFQNERMFEFSTPESLLEVDFHQPLYAVVDRLAIDPDQRERVANAIETCYRQSGEAILRSADGALELKFNEKFQCKLCDTKFEEPSPTLFSFNSPMGACPRCHGFGNTVDYDFNLCVPVPTLSLKEGAVDPWTKPSHEWGFDEFLKLARGRVRLDVPVLELTAEEKSLVKQSLNEFFGWLETKKYKVQVRVMLARYRGYAECPDCQGSRLRREALYVRIGDKTMSEVSKMNIADANEFFSQLQLSPEENAIADKVLLEVKDRLRFLNEVGLEYLTLDRRSASLSGGESQRITLATCLGSRLVGATYVLDEPSIGLHSRDTERLINIMKGLRDLGNTILVVEHDADVMHASDFVVDLGPGAGEHGGKVQFAGPHTELMKFQGPSLTARYLRGDAVVVRQEDRREPDFKKALRFYGCYANNVKGVDVEIPLNLMCVVTGVSGSGKSSLVHEVIYKSLEKRLDPTKQTDQAESAEKTQAGCKRMEGLSQVKQLVMVDQSPIGRTPRSNPVTYVKAFDVIRDLLSSTPEAQSLKYGPGYFSFNVPGGRCDVCEGDGTVTVEMQFLADVELLCEECRGTRFKSTTLEIKYRGLNVHDILNLTIEEALRFFHDQPKVANRLKPLNDVGLGYLRLGQSGTTLSGGEAQRVKLASHLSNSVSSGTLYVFDEPTTGLHFDDIAKLLRAFDRLIDKGGSILLIEHNMDVIRSADWIIDMGPNGGSAGGQVVGVGTPEAIAQLADSHTGRFLKQVLQ